MKPPAHPTAAADADAVKITENQRQILLRLFAGSHEDQIAADKGRSASTIFNTIRRVREQLGARNEYDLMRACLRRRIVKLGEIYAVADKLHRGSAVAGTCGRT